MSCRFIIHNVLILTTCFALADLAAEPSEPNQSSKYLEAVQEFADNVLKYGRDTYGPKHTPLFVDGLNVNTHEPVKWISPKGDLSKTTETEEWILSNFASQQTLLRTLDGLSTLTGDPKYRDAAMQAIKYAFENLRAPNGLLYWGDSTAYDAYSDQTRYLSTSTIKLHVLKVHYPFYELMWQVDPEATKTFIEAYWFGHVIDWSNLDFNRAAAYLSTSGVLETPWGHEYKGGPTFFMSKVSWAAGFFHTGTSLAHAATTLYRLSGQEEPLVWSKRLIQRFVDTRHPKTGITAHLYNQQPQRMFPNESMKENFADPYTTVFPFHPFERKRNGQLMYFGEHWQPLPWISLLLVGDTLDEQGKEFSRWALEELTAWGKSSYRKRDNVFVPILTDGTNIEGIVVEKDCALGPRGDTAIPFIADPACFWLYATAYRVTNDKFMWDMARDIALGNDLGDIGETSGQKTGLNRNTTCSDSYCLLGFLDLYNKTTRQEFLVMARRIADNIVKTKFHKGFPVMSKEHIYSRFGCLEPLALLHLTEAITDGISSLPRVWPECPIFIPRYRYKSIGSDRWHIYRLKGSPEVPWSLQELAHIGDFDQIKLLLNSGVQVDSWDDSALMTALHRAAIAGHKDIAELLITYGARVDHGGSKSTPLHCAVQYGHKDVVELLLAHGADVNVKNGNGRTPMDIISSNDDPIKKLLLAQAGDQEAAKSLLTQGIDIKVKDDKGMTPLCYAIREGHEEFVRVLIDQGADVDPMPRGNNSPIFYAVRGGYVNIVKLLLDHGAQINMKNPSGFSVFELAVRSGNRELVDIFISKGADVSTFHMTAAMGDMRGVDSFLAKGVAVDTRDEHGWTPLFWAIRMGQIEMVKLLIAQGADVNLETKSQETPLRHAVRGVGIVDIVQLLVTNGADVNAASRGMTPLHFAVVDRHKEVAEVLIANGADVNAKTARGLTPLDLAKRAEHREIVELLRKHGAKE